MTRRKLAHLGEMTSKSTRQICSSVSSTTDDGEGTQYALTPPSPQQAPSLSRAASATMTKSLNSSPMTFRDKKEKIRSFLLDVESARCQPSHMHNSICWRAFLFTKILEAVAAR